MCLHGYIRARGPNPCIELAFALSISVTTGHSKGRRVSLPTRDRLAREEYSMRNLPVIEDRIPGVLSVLRRAVKMRRATDGRVQKDTMGASTESD